MEKTKPKKKKSGEERTEKAKRRREELKELYHLYKKQYKEKTKKELETGRKRKQTLMNIELPPKPSESEITFSDGCQQVLKAIGRTFCLGSRFTGAARFDDHSDEVALEIDITSNRNEAGEFVGKRTPFDNVLGSCEGKGRLWCDMIWDEGKQKYQEGVCFRWMDEQQGVMTVLEFNTVCDHLDIKHLFFEGVVMRYPAFADPKDPELNKVTQYGIFDFLCSSRKTHHGQSMDLGSHAHEWLYKEEKTNEENPEEPKYVQRMFDYSEKIEEARSKDKRESLKLPEGNDWAGHLFGKRYSIHSPRNSKSAPQSYAANLDLQVLSNNLPRRSSTFRSRPNSPGNPPSPSPS